MIFRNAYAHEIDAVLTLYKSAIGSPFCVWDEGYPGRREAAHDFATNNLYVLVDGVNVIGALSVFSEREMDHLPYWQVRDGSEREVGRIVVDLAYRGQGLGYTMVTAIAKKLQQEGCSSIHLSAAAGHIPALKTYEKAGFSVLGQREMYEGGLYCLLEKIL